MKLSTEQVEAIVTELGLLSRLLDLKRSD
jgi:hypothetical protein